MFALYVLTVLLAIIWGLWVLYFPRLTKNGPLGLKVKYLLLVVIISIIPIANFACTVVSCVWMIFTLIFDGRSSLFPENKTPKLDNFLNYEFLKTKT